MHKHCNEDRSHISIKVGFCISLQPAAAINIPYNLPGTFNDLHVLPGCPNKLESERNFLEGLPLSGIKNLNFNAHISGTTAKLQNAFVQLNQHRLLVFNRNEAHILQSIQQFKSNHEGLVKPQTRMKRLHKHRIFRGTV